jgi:hypothetical protein
VGQRAEELQSGAASGGPDTEAVKHGRFTRTTGWLTAGAAALSAVVAAVALIVNTVDRPDDASPVVTQTPATGPPAADATPPRTRTARTIAIESMVFVGADLDGPAFEFRGTAELRDPDDEEIFVVARPLVASTVSEEGTWLTSPPAEVDSDGTWLTRIAKPPLPEGSFDFAAVIAPTPAKTPSIRPGTRPAFGASLGMSLNVRRVCKKGDSIESQGAESCIVLDATEVKRYEP